MGSDAPVSFVAGLRKFIIILGKLISFFYKTACLEKALSGKARVLVLFGPNSSKREATVISLLSQPNF